MNDFLADVINVAMSCGVSVMQEPLSHDHAVPMCDPESKSILLNSIWHNPREMAFQCAHELSHLLNDDEAPAYYATISTGSEGSANHSAVDLLVPMYFADTEAEDANVRRFMDDLAVPNWLEDYAADSICNFYHRARPAYY